MFRHSTKQNVRSQDRLRKSATDSLDKDRQILCESVYSNSYDIELPESSVEMLNNVVGPLTGFNSVVSGPTRRVYTCGIFEHTSNTRLRLSFVQPEISSATASLSSSHAETLKSSRNRVIAEMNNPSPGRIAVSREKCQVAGRLSPYIVDKAGLGPVAKWSYFNASKSRFFYISSSVENVETLSMTKETISIYQSFAHGDCAIVYVSSMRCFKVTASPGEEDETESPNKSTCVFLYCDGTFKVLGTPHKSHKVCLLLRKTIIAAHSSSMCSQILSTLVPLEKPGSQSKS